jgi:hypothetical protein
MNPVRRLAVTLGLSALLLAVLVPAATAGPTAYQATNACNGVLHGQGPGGTLAKSLVSVQPADGGTFTLTYQVTTDRPFNTYRLRDCAFTDVNGNQAFDQGEPLFGTDKSVSVGAPDSPSAQVSIVVTGKAGDTVCDRAALSGNGIGNDRSNVLCTTLAETPVPVGAVGGIGLTLLAAGGFVVAQRRSRRRRAAAMPIT